MPVGLEVDIRGDTSGLKSALGEAETSVKGFGGTVAGGIPKLALYGGARALLYPIQAREPFGLVLAEAMACGTPVAARDKGAVREVVQDDQGVQERETRLHKQNERIEHDNALARVMTAVLKDDTELFKQLMDNDGFALDDLHGIRTHI